MMAKESYFELLGEIKAKILEAQVKSAMAANSQMLLLYWQIGNFIIANQVQNGWGAKVVELLANDISKEVQKVKGFSKRNLLYMRNFAKSYPLSTIVKMNDFEAAFNPDTELVQQLVARLEVVNNQPSEIVQQPAAQMDKMKSAQDNDTIGILLCKGKNDVVAEYALKGFNSAIGISDYQLSKALPDELKSTLPQIEDLENELNKNDELQ
jgi:hypothetical protein